MTFEITATRLIHRDPIERVTIPTFWVEAECELHARTMVGKIMGFPLNVNVELKEMT